MRCPPAPAALAAALGLLPPATAADPVRVTVVVVYATRTPVAPNPKLADLAAEVRNAEAKTTGQPPKLQGFTLADVLRESLTVGQWKSFALPEGQKLMVRVNQDKGADGRVGLTIQPPESGEITYSCVSRKFYPAVTPVQTPAGQMVVAVMAQPEADSGPPPAKGK